MKRPTIGILTWREGKKFAEPAYFRKLLKAGRELGCRVFLFSPKDVKAHEKQVKGYVLNEQGKWHGQLFDRPDAVFDRYRYTPTQAFKDYVAFRSKSSFLYVNNRLANKWRVHDVLVRDSRMHRWLPETWLYTRSKLATMLERHKILYVKPINGTGGRNILRVEKIGGGYRLLGRDKQRLKVSAMLTQLSAVQNWVDKWTKGQKYIVQQGLHLDLIPKRTIDMRLLIQKDGHGEWSITGHGIRIGGERSATSNLHGGGKAVPAATFLRPHFGEDDTARIVKDCEALAQQTAESLEAHFGRMVEFGLDIGIDASGRAWLIEVNPKPGREIFSQMGDKERYQKAIRRPLEYALFLARTNGQSQLRIHPIHARNKANG
ncbi:YheC/YheD family protein [Brevibacillus invocatus]|uniref:YheC/YheD family protein n=1 Tax=Brevibacillus invocatus TaxID=173959 RepID=A0A3M8CIB2_9BACL|nr:YheC/YheD family protein [Brevibacillus invocatus]RNB75283.1 YheC/YheD family protein [Brevibacillus invocatus]